MEIKNYLQTMAPEWLRGYRRGWLHGDFTAGVIVTIMLIPQSLAYALIAGLPPEVGLYASILPMVAYALFGTSMTLAVGPVAVASLMTASALAPLAPAGSPLYVALAAQLAMLSGVFLILFGVMRFGFISHLLSHPIINGFIIGSAILIAVGQVKHLLGVRVESQDVLDIVVELWRMLPSTNTTTLIIGISALAVLFLSREQIPALLRRLGFRERNADLMGKLAPMFVVIVTTVAVAKMGLHVHHGVNVVGTVPKGIPSFNFTLPDYKVLEQLWLPALLITIIGFVESVSMAQSLAMKRNQRINPDKELLGLGAANVASALSGGYAVTGGFSRSVVNFSAGAHTPLAGVIAAGLMTVVLIGFTDYFANLPQATLSATIIVAVLGLVDFSTLKEAWKYDKTDAIALLSTAVGVLVLGVEEGVMIGVLFSLSAYFWRSGHPHIAIVGRVPGTEHFRNVDRHKVEGAPGILVIRIDENLFFGNVQMIEDMIYARTDNHEELTDVILMFSAVNRIDATALKILNDINLNLMNSGKKLHLTEVKGPVMDRLRDTEFLKKLTGKCFLSTHEACQALGAREMKTGY